MNVLYDSRELILNTMESEIFPLKSTKGKEIVILTPKKILQRLPKALVQVKASNTSENLLNNTRQAIHSLNLVK